MFRRGLILLIFLAAMVGCGSDDEPSSDSSDAAKQDAPAVQSDSSKDGNRDSTLVATADETSPKDPIVIEPPPVKPLAVDNELREKLAKLGRLKVQDSNGQDSAIKEELDRLDADSQSQIRQGLLDSSADVRRGAAYYLMESALSDPNVAAAFSVILNDDDAGIRHIGLQAIRGMPEELLAKTTPELVKFVSRADESTANRVSAARLIGSLGARGRPAFPQLKQTVLADTEEQVRKACLFSVSKIASPADAVALYRQVLGSDAPPGVRRVAAFWLGKVGTAAEVAANDLASALEDPDKDVREAARDALVALGSASVPALVAKLASQNPVARSHAAFALGKLGSAAKSALPELRKLLTDDNEEVRKLAALAIREIELSP